MELKYTYTFCDICNPKQFMENDRGYTIWPREVSCADFDWVFRDGKDICPECQEELEEENCNLSKEG